jgi:hypothetical protein
MPAGCVRRDLSLTATAHRLRASPPSFVAGELSVKGLERETNGSPFNTEYLGSCHCGAVTFEVETDQSLTGRLATARQ